ncbi:MAG: MarR family winged helix-turn-helix transcriptional regulator [Acidimicrobiales bacterium]
MAQDWLLPDELRVLRAYTRSGRALFAQFDRELQRDAGLPRAYLEILWLLDHAPGRSLRMNELADAAASHASRITYAVARLEEDGLVRRDLCARDRRGWFAVLTEEGSAALRRAAPCYVKRIREHLLAPLSPEDREHLARIGETLLAHLAEARERGEPLATAGQP